MSEPTPNPSIGRASAFLASGTIVSRLLGFVKAVLLAATIGSIGLSGDAFAVANQLPNTVYVIIAGGVLGAIFVPQIVQATLHADRGHAYINKLITITLVVLLVATVAATLLAPALVSLYASKFSPEQHALATGFAYWCLPQIFFYGLYSVLGEILNAHKLFGPFTWAPVVNNVVAMIGLGVFIALFGTDQGGERLISDWSPDMVVLLAGSATVGVAAQAVVLFFFWRRINLRFRPDFAWKGVGLRETGKLAGWSFAMILLTTGAGIVQSNVASAASGDAAVFALQNAWLIFMLPHSVITVSIATAYFTRLSEHVREKRDSELKHDVSRAISQISLLIVLAAAVLIVVAIPFARLFTSSDLSDVTALGLVIIGFVLGLVPFCVLFVLQRTFYALSDTRTPFFFTLVQVIVYSALAFGCLLLPREWIGVGLALSMTVSIVVQMCTAAILLRRRLNGLAVARTARSLVRYSAAAVPATVVGATVVWALGGYTGGWAIASISTALATLMIGGVVVSVLYLLMLAAMRSPELAEALGPVRGILTRLRRR
ncbi:hypothetical protein GCM10027416_00890 [Okibacterium endophyticum]